MNASAHNAATIGMDFIDNYVLPLVSTIDRLMLEVDADVPPICKILQLQAAECHNLLDGIREDAEQEGAPC